jgi:2-haloacid dehalogenase
MKTENIIFDFGGVLVDWNPRYLYKDHFQNENEMEHFLKNSCTDEWNLEQDRGRSLSDGTILLQNKFPEFHSMIQLFYDKWETMLKSDIPETVSLLYKLKAKYKIYGLSFYYHRNRDSLTNHTERTVVSTKHSSQHAVPARLARRCCNEQ